MFNVSEQYPNLIKAINDLTLDYYAIATFLVLMERLEFFGLVEKEITKEKMVDIKKTVESFFKERLNGKELSPELIEDVRRCYVDQKVTEEMKDTVARLNYFGFAAERIAKSCH